MKDERERLAALAAEEEALRSLETSESRSKARRQESSESVKMERRKKAQIQELENQVAALETKLAEIGRKLENRAADPAEIVRLGKEYQSVQKEMDAKLAEWEGLQV
jgi:hypothetical protein